MDFNLESSRPIWQQLAAQLRRKIVTGVWAAGERGPSVRDLAAEAGVNPNTMQRALAQLESDGLVITNRTAPRTVTEDITVLEDMRRALAAEQVANYFNEMNALGFTAAEAAAMAQAEGSKE